ncbi:MAG: IclR family transcriptional regulator C-terminal domain-containing protein [Solirubrobacteraceae bacterium]
MTEPSDQDGNREDTDPDRDEPNPRQSLSLKVGLDVLGCFTAAQPELGSAEIGAILGVGRARVHRRIATLRALGYLEATPTRRDRITVKVVDLGLATLSSIGLPQDAQPFLEELAQRTSYTASIAILDGEEIVMQRTILATGAGKTMLGRLLAQGRRLPAYCTAPGKVLLAHLPHYVRDERLGDLVLPPRTSNTITHDGELREELARVGERGIGRDDQECHQGLISLAAPVRDEWGETVAAVSLSASAQNASLETLVGTAQDALLTITRELSARLGNRTSASD